MSPPCVPYFDGDNGGATYTGVRSDEVRVLAYFDTGGYSNESTPPGGTYVFVNDTSTNPPCSPGPLETKDCDHILIRGLQAFGRYFNERFQTYGRQVRFIAYFSNASSAAARRADAADNFEAIRPFAVLDLAIFQGHNQAYAEAMADQGALVFGGPAQLGDDVYAEHAPHLWGFWPDSAQRAELYASYVCQKVAPYPTRRFGMLAGHGPPNGGPRRFGLYYTTDPVQPGLHRFRELVKERLSDCGVEWAAEASFSHEGYAVNGRDTGFDQHQAAAIFRSADVTTVLWLGGNETRFTHAAASQGYFPEIVVAGDGELDANFSGVLQNQLVWQNAWGIQHLRRTDSIEEHFGYRALREGGASHDDARARADTYPHHLLLFSAIQLAGPTLDPDTVEAGFHAIPEHTSSTPYAAACFFAGGSTCVKDTAEVWWDPLARAAEGQTPGCMRMVDGGRRTLAGEWTGSDEVFTNPADPCNEHPGAIRLRLG